MKTTEKIDNYLKEAKPDFSFLTGYKQNINTFINDLDNLMNNIESSFTSEIAEMEINNAKRSDVNKVDNFYGEILNRLEDIIASLENLKKVISKGI